MARPSKYSPERVKRITDALASGNTRATSAAYGGISIDTFLAWIRRFNDFSTLVKDAEAKAEVAHVANIAKAAQSGTWQASAWWLERRKPAEWGRVDRLEVEFRAKAEQMAQELGVPVETIIERAEAIANRRA